MIYSIKVKLPSGLIVSDDAAILFSSKLHDSAEWLT